jgi:hypothetical protein
MAKAKLFGFWRKDVHCKTWLWCEHCFARNEMYARVVQKGQRVVWFCCVCNRMIRMTGGDATSDIKKHYKRRKKEAKPPIAV